MTLKNRSFCRRPRRPVVACLRLSCFLRIHSSRGRQPPTPKDDANHSLSLPGVSGEARVSVPAAGAAALRWMGGFASRAPGGPIARSLPGSRRLQATVAWG